MLIGPVRMRSRTRTDLDLKLRNALHHGEAIDLSWRSLQDRTQNLKVGFNYPSTVKSAATGGGDVPISAHRLMPNATSFLVGHHKKAW